MILPNNIRYLRKKRNWSQEHLAKLLGYKSFTTIQKWETGVSEPPLKKAHALADLFGVDIDLLTKVDLEHKKIPLSDLNHSKQLDNEEVDGAVHSFQCATSSRIKRRMRELGLDSSKMMTDLDVDEETVKRYVDGMIITLSDDEVDRIAAVLETTSRYLLLETDDPYDYDRDPEGRFERMPSFVYSRLEDMYSGDAEAIWRAWSEGDPYSEMRSHIPLYGTTSQGAATLTDRSAGLFASNLMYIMSQRNTTPDAVANRISRMDSGTIHDFLSLERMPTTEDVYEIARSFDILPERMLNTDIEADNRLRKRKADYHRLLGSFGIPKRRDFLCEDLSSRARRFRFIERLLMYGATPDEIEERAGLSDADMDLCFQGRIHRIDSNKVYRLACEIDTNDQYLLLNSNDPYCYETDKEGRLNGIPEEAEEDLEGIASQELLCGIWTDSKKEIYDDPKEMQRILAIMEHRDSYDNEFESLKPVLSKLNRLDLFYREHALSMISRFLDWYIEDPLDEYDREGHTNSD